MYDILVILVEIFHDFGWFFATRIRFIEADPDPKHCYKVMLGRDAINIRIQNTWFATLGHAMLVFLSYITFL